MTGEELIAEGQRLAKPCVYLTATAEQGVALAAIWGGNGVVPPPEDGDYQHWLSISGAALPASIGVLPGVLSIYTDEENCETGIVVMDAVAELSVADTDGLPLYAQPASSLPPIDAVFKFGSPAIKEWLAENDWLPGEDEDESEFAYNSNFPDKHIVNIYEAAWQNQMPLYDGGAHAVLGGWHMPWPDGDWYDLLEQTLVVWTFEDSEPWVEVWRDTKNNYTVLQRVT